MSHNGKALLDKKAELVREFKELEHLVENGKFTADDEARFAKVNADYEAVEKQLQVVERSRAIQQELQDAEQARRDREKRGESVDLSREYREVWYKMLSVGENGLSEQERNVLRTAKFTREIRGTATQITTTNSLGGFLVPIELMNEIERMMKYYGGMMQACRIIQTPGGGTLNGPTVDDTATSANQQTTEGTGITVQDLTFGNTAWSAYTYATILKHSWQLDTDSQLFNEALITEIAAERLGRKANTELTTGNGSAKPVGITDATGGSTLGKTAASTTAFTAAEIIDLQHSVDPEYRNNPGSAFMMHDLVAAAIRKLQIGTGDARYLWEPSLQLGQPDRLYGKPVFINNDLSSTFTTGQKLIYFGDWSKYIIRQVGGIYAKRLDERYADELNVGHVFATRLDGKLWNRSAVKHLVLA